MSKTLRWPDGRGKFVDDDTERTPDGERMEVFAGTEITVEDDDVADHYVSRGFDVVDSDADTDGGDAETDDFDVEAFLDRTPVHDVVDDIKDGEADGHLDEVYDAAERLTVEDAVETRRDALGED